MTNEQEYKLLETVDLLIQALERLGTGSSPKKEVKEARKTMEIVELLGRM